MTVENLTCTSAGLWREVKFEEREKEEKMEKETMQNRFSKGTGSDKMLLNCYLR